MGWAKLDLVTIHVYYGRATANDPCRVQEIEDLAHLLGAKISRMIGTLVKALRLA